MKQQDDDYDIGISTAGQVKEVGDMISELNRDGNLRGFICEMRRKFKQQSESGS